MEEGDCMSDQLIAIAIVFAPCLLVLGMTSVIRVTQYRKWSYILEPKTQRISEQAAQAQLKVLCGETPKQQEVLNGNSIVS